MSIELLPPERPRTEIIQIQDMLDYFNRCTPLDEAVNCQVALWLTELRDVKIALSKSKITVFKV